MDYKVKLHIQEIENLLIQKGKEILMFYTCYPVKDMEKTPYRYVVYEKRFKIY